MKKLSELFTDESTWAQKMFTGFRPLPMLPPTPVSEADPTANCFCLSEGIRRVYPAPYSDGEARRALRQLVIEAIHKLFPTREGGIINFNDHRNTTFADIQAVIREVESAK